MTINRFRNYLGGCPVLSIRGRTFPVEIDWAPNSVTDINTAIERKLVEIHTGSDMIMDNGVSVGHVLVFFSGREDIDKMAKRLSALPWVITVVI